ncbi:unnamed protein product [Agarophyton chilense]
MGNTSSVSLRLRRRRIDDPAALDLPFKSSGLYPTCNWDDKLVRRLILRGDLAPRYPGEDDPSPNVREECPICMLVYPVLNQTKCCQARLCTECYLQIRPPRHNKEPCPFCKYKRLDATCRGPRDAADLDREEMEQHNALQAIKRANANTLCANSALALPSPPTLPSPAYSSQLVSSSSVTPAVPSSSSASSPSLVQPSVSTSSFSPTTESSGTVSARATSSPVSDLISVPSSSLVATVSSSVSESSTSTTDHPAQPSPEHNQQPQTCTQHRAPVFVSSFQQNATESIALETAVNDVNYVPTPACENKHPSPVAVQRTAQQQNGQGESSDVGSNHSAHHTADHNAQTPDPLSRQCFPSRQSATNSSLHFNEEFEEECVAMHEAIRRSLLDI